MNMMMLMAIAVVKVMMETAMLMTTVTGMMVNLLMVMVVGDDHSFVLVTRGTDLISCVVAIPFRLSYGSETLRVTPPAHLETKWHGSVKGSGTLSLRPLGVSWGPFWSLWYGSGAFWLPFCLHIGCPGPQKLTQNAFPSSTSQIPEFADGYTLFNIFMIPKASQKAPQYR